MAEEPQPLKDNRALTGKIVAAYLRRNQVTSDQMPALISTVYQALTVLGKPSGEAEASRTPAVPIRRSVHRDYVVCLDCGWKGQMLRRHVTTAHGLSIPEYRVRWSLPTGHAITAAGYSERRSTLAKQHGLGRGTTPGDAAMTPGAPAQPKRRGRQRSEARPA